MARPSGDERATVLFDREDPAHGAYDAHERDAMTWLFITATVLLAITLGASVLYWSVYAGTGEQVARQRAVGFFRFGVVIVLATFNIWIFTRVGAAIKDIWFPSPPPPPPPALIDGQLPGRPPPEETKP